MRGSCPLDIEQDHNVFVPLDELDAPTRSYQVDVLQPETIHADCHVEYNSEYDAPQVRAWGGVWCSGPGGMVAAEAAPHMLPLCCHASKAMVPTQAQPALAHSY